MKKHAFTLLELLVVMAIIVVLAGISFPVFASVRKSSNKSREVSAGRQLAMAYSAAAQDQDGELMAGYANNAEAWDDLGRKVQNPISNRYPWRLAKYLNYKVIGTLLVNDQAKIADLRDQQSMYNYLVSLSPTFGMNALMVGGDYHGALAPTTLAKKKFGNFCLTRMGQVHNSARLILFASAHYVTGDADYYGYHTVEPPNLTGSNWEGKYNELEPKSLGYLHLRYNEQAVVVMLDGHVELLGEKQLRDMRRWSNQASEADEPNFTLGQR